MFKIIAAITAVAAIGTGVVVSYIFMTVPEMPNFDLNRWWGIGTMPKEEITSVRHFRVDFNDTMISDLKQRLRNRRPMTRPLEDAQSTYGMNTIYLEKILDYWVEKYDFKKRAELLNRFPHYKTRIQGLDIHFVRVKPDLTGKRGIEVFPLLMLHGWPSSSKEFDKVIPMLTTVRKGYNFVFEVVAPDLPGFGFSEGTNKQGLTPVQMSIMMRNLMKRLGFDQFYIQAGDWGSQVASHLSTIFPNQVLGFLSNMPVSSMKKSIFKVLLGSLAPSLVDSKYAHRIYPLKDSFGRIVRESGYFHIQATKPDTLGVALTDSPAGLAAYLMEKMATTSNSNQLDTPHGGLESLNLDDILDTVTIVWANNCIVTSMRIYAEGVGKNGAENRIVHNIPTPVPTAAVKFQHEVLYQPNWILRDKFPNLVRSTVYEFGGHFAALQTPQVLADEVFDSTVEFIKFQCSRK